MKKYLTILSLPVLLIACNQSKNNNEGTTRVSEQKTTRDQQTSAGNKQSTGNNSDVVGEWSQQYAVLDQNGNAQLEPDERNGTKSNMGFNWFRFNNDGSCQYDSDMKFKGRYEVLDDNGKRKLNVTVNGFDETYKYTIVNTANDELLLFSSGAFIVFKKS